MTTIYVTSGRAIDVDFDYEKLVKDVCDREDEGCTHVFVVDTGGKEHCVRITSIEIIEKGN